MRDIFRWGSRVNGGRVNKGPVNHYAMSYHYAICHTTHTVISTNNTINHIIMRTTAMRTKSAWTVTFFGGCSGACLVVKNNKILNVVLERANGIAAPRITALPHRKPLVSSPGHSPHLSAYY